MKLKACLTLALIAALWTSPLAAAEPQSAGSLASISAAMQKFVDDGQIAGSVTLVARDGKIVHHEAVGLADIESEKPMKKGSLFSIASMTKPIAATAVLMLRDDGKLELDDPVSRYLPEYAAVKLLNGDQLERDMTIRDVLTHTSGLAGKQTFEGTLSDAVLELADRPLAFQPGARWQYSPGLNVAGRIIEVVAQQPLQDFLQERLFEPLKMNSTTFFPNQRQQGRMATLYQPGPSENTLVTVDNRIVNFADVKGPNPSGGLVSNARDLFRFYQMILNGGKWRGQQLVSAEAVKLMTQCQTGDLQTGFTPGNCWGLGWCIIREPQGVTGMLSPGTFGHGGAFGTQGWVDPKTDSIYILLIQRDRLPNSDASEIRETFQRLAAAE